jgi:hypothetical protein
MAPFGKKKTGCKDHKRNVKGRRLLEIKGNKKYYLNY